MKKKMVRTLSFMLVVMIVVALLPIQVLAAEPVRVEIREPVWISDDAAQLKVEIFKQNSVTVEDVEWFIATDPENLEMAFTEPVAYETNRTYRSYYAWFDTKTEGELSLVPGTTYYYMMVATYGSSRFESSVSSFTTTGETPPIPEEGAPADDIPEEVSPTDEVPVEAPPVDEAPVETAPAAVIPEKTFTVDTEGTEFVTANNAKIVGMINCGNEYINCVFLNFGTNPESLMTIYWEDVPSEVNAEYVNFRMWVNLTDEVGWVLEENTTYYYQCGAWSDDTQRTGEVKSFTTSTSQPALKPVPAPTPAPTPAPQPEPTPAPTPEPQNTLTKEAQEMLSMIERSGYNTRPLAEYSYANEKAGNKWTPSSSKMVEAYYAALFNMVNGNSNTHLEYTDGFMQRFISAYFSTALDLAPWVEPVADYIMNSNKGIDLLQTVDILLDLRDVTTKSNMKKAIDSLLHQYVDEMAELAAFGLDLGVSVATDAVINILAAAIGSTPNALSFIVDSTIFIISEIDLSTKSNYSVKAYQQIRESFWTMYGKDVNSGNFTSDKLETMRQYYRYLYYLTQEQYMHAANVMGAEKWWKDQRIQSDRNELGQMLSVNFYPYSG